MQDCFQFRASKLKTVFDKPEQVQWTATKMKRGLEQMTYEKIQRELNLVGLLKRRLRHDFAVFNYIMEDFKGERTRLFLEAHSERTRDT